MTMESRFLRVSGDMRRCIKEHSHGLEVELSGLRDQITLELGRVVFLIFAVGHIPSIPTATPRLSPTWAAMARRSHGGYHGITAQLS